MEGNVYSEDLVETLEQYHRSGRSLDSLDGTISGFCDKSFFDVRTVAGQLVTQEPFANVVAYIFLMSILYQNFSET